VESHATPVRPTQAATPSSAAATVALTAEPAPAERSASTMPAAKPAARARPAETTDAVGAAERARAPTNAKMASVLHVSPRAREKSAVRTAAEARAVAVLKEAIARLGFAASAHVMGNAKAAMSAAVRTAHARAMRLALSSAIVVQTCVRSVAPPSPTTAAYLSARAKPAETTDAEGAAVAVHRVKSVMEPSRYASTARQTVTTKAVVQMAVVANAGAATQAFSVEKMAYARPVSPPVKGRHVERTDVVVSAEPAPRIHSVPLAPVKRSFAPSNVELRASTCLEGARAPAAPSASVNRTAALASVRVVTKTTSRSAAFPNARTRHVVMTAVGDPAAHARSTRAASKESVSPANPTA